MIHIGPIDLEKKAAIVAVILENPFETSKKAAKMGADILELRLDLLAIRDPEKAEELIGKIKFETGLPVLITNRSSIEGGTWEGNEAERIRLLTDLLPLKDGPEAIDIELSADKEERDRAVKMAKVHGKTVIISFHDFLKTPSIEEMETIFEAAFLAGADIAKIAVMPHSRRNVLDLLGLSLDAAEAGRAVCTISMGNTGKHTRVIAPFYGSVLTYASVEDTISAAPGQLPVNEVKKIMELLE
jgi:3-dehydroquinate dehydratase-1